MKELRVCAALAAVTSLLFAGSCAEEPKSKDLVYRVPGMEKVTVRSDLVYKKAGDLTLHADLYLPPNTPAEATLPAIIFVLGDAAPEVLRNAKDWAVFHSYGRLAGASGFAGVTFNHRSHENFARIGDVRSDIADLIGYVRANAPAWSINKDRICLWFFSGTGPHLVLAMGENADFVRCIVAYYPVLAAPVEAFASAASAAEFSSIAQLKRNAPRVPPILLAKAGRDAPFLNRLIDEFRAQALASNAPLEYLEHPQGRHAFDILDDDETSREIVRKTMEFIQHRFAQSQ